MDEHIAQRISKDLGLSDLAEVLSERLSGSDLHSLLLAVLKRRVRRIEPSKLTVLSTVTKSCNLDARLLNKIESVAYEIARAYEAVELSPLSPFGSVSILTGLDQGNVLSTIRAFECASDPTIGLALECAQRRKDLFERKNTTRLCCNQRVLRFPLPQNPAYTAHFKLFALINAGRDSGSFAFEAAALKEQIEFYLSFLVKLESSDFSFNDIEVEISDTRLVAYFCELFNISKEMIKSQVRARDSASSARVLENYANTWPMAPAKPSEELSEYSLPKHLLSHLAVIEQEVIMPLNVSYPNVRVIFNLHRLTGLDYYDGPCFHIKMKNDRGEKFMLADGGLVDWTQALLNDAKERLMTSAIGTELICKLFQKNGCFRR